MPFDAGSVTSSIDLSYAPATKALQEFAGKVSSFGSRFTGIMSSLAAGPLGLAAAFTAATAVTVNFFKMVISAAAEAEDAQVRLEAAFRATGTAAHPEQLADYALALQKVTVYSDEAVKSMMAVLAGMEFTEKEILALTPVVVDLAAVFGQELGPMAEVVGRSFLTGMPRGLRQFLGSVDMAVLKSGDLSRYLAYLKTRCDEAAAAMAKAGTGPMKQFRNAVDELKEVIGDLVLGPFQGFIQSLTEIVNQLTAGVKWLTKWRENVAKITEPLEALNKWLDAHPFVKRIFGGGLAQIKEQGIGPLLPPGILRGAYEGWRQLEKGVAGYGAALDRVAKGTEIAGKTVREVSEGDYNRALQRMENLADKENWSASRRLNVYQIFRAKYAGFLKDREELEAALASKINALQKQVDQDQEKASQDAVAREKTALDKRLANFAAFIAARERAGKPLAPKETAEDFSRIAADYQKYLTAGKQAEEAAMAFGERRRQAILAAEDAVYAHEVALLDDLIARRQISVGEEEGQLAHILALHAATAEQRAAIEQRLFAVRETLETALYAMFQKRMEKQRGATPAEELYLARAALNAVTQGSDEYAAALTRVAQAEEAFRIGAKAMAEAMALPEQEYEFYVSEGRQSIESLIALLKQHRDAIIASKDASVEAGQVILSYNQRIAAAERALTQQQLAAADAEIEATRTGYQEKVDILDRMLAKHQSVNDQLELQRERQATVNGMVSRALDLMRLQNLPLQEQLVVLQRIYDAWAAVGIKLPDIADRIREINYALDQQAWTLRNVILGALDGIKSSLTDFFDKAMQRAATWGEFFQSVLAAIRRSIAQMLAEFMTEQIRGSIMARPQVQMPMPGGGAAGGQTQALIQALNAFTGTAPGLSQGLLGWVGAAVQFGVTTMMQQAAALQQDIAAGMAMGAATANAMAGIEMGAAAVGMGISGGVFMAASAGMGISAGSMIVAAGIMMSAAATMASISFWDILPFQHGGIVTRPTLALIGERGPEAVIPLKPSVPRLTRAMGPPAFRQLSEFFGGEEPERRRFYITVENVNLTADSVDELGLRRFARRLGSALGGELDRALLRMPAVQAGIS